MSGFRIVRKESPFVQIDTTILKDNRLSWSARGFAVYLLTQPESMQDNILTNLQSPNNTNTEEIKRAFAELVRYGYIEGIKSAEQGK